jgi:release factor glutamine methyltransferase
MPDLRALLADASARLGNRLESELLLAHALHRDRAWLFAHATDAPEPSQAAAFAALLERRLAGEPLAYITGRRGFWSMDLQVTADTLIPRPETERLVEVALERIPDVADRSVADLGTGSGAIALAIARERPHARVLATDASAGALAVARRNAGRLGIANVRFGQGDWCTALGDGIFDIIVSNPPYIEDGDEHLWQGDLRHEPRAALASGPDGLDAIRTIARDARTRLAPDGWLLLEHGWQQAAAVRTVLQDNGYAAIFTAQDLESRDRVTGGQSP